jgi:GGDEF domain-containing protein
MATYRDAEALIKNADMAMYQVKEQGARLPLPDRHNKLAGQRSLNAREPI